LRQEEPRKGVSVTITKEMPIAEVVQKYPQTIEVFLSHGLFCLGCAASMFENIEQGALAHGIEVDPLMTDLNLAVEQQTPQGQAAS
jgi:hybrid cluster-associated redox disulfide protein